MAVNHMTLNNSAQNAAELANAVSLLTMAINQADNIKAVMEACIDGADYTAVETVFGLPTGKGATVYNLLAGTVAALDDTNVAQFVAWLG